MKRILGIDFGMKRTGIAITDENNIIASGLTTVPTKEVMQFLIKTVKEKNVGTLVLGEPKRLNMEDSHSSQNVRLFKEALEKQFLGLEIVMMDERFTSKMAMQSLIDGGVSKKKRRQKELIDEVSATIILQSYMSSI
ncbi:Holliday junction resolvase RuvX [Brumimicrobium aurantiacum]|uniref:Putative pre-16S rRNA nuclease n=1 Tax=Brumimicrobium aurantiacum TaxID=1737063 RepID=A0A3E1EVZ4_9FLAO|nr:Holliday junction resolvase RuvX [Brumimicrobium aurantiacum]RFC53731.1 Holliday junction resolvase RuvX [Brumimicrobium aurantiacum]